MKPEGPSQIIKLFTRNAYGLKDPKDSVCSLQGRDQNILVRLFKAIPIRRIVVTMRLFVFKIQDK